MPSTVTVDRIVQTWELYCEGSYRQIAELKAEATGDLGDLCALARLELDPTARVPNGSGIFADLLQGMRAFHQGEDRAATALLGAWLQKKAYFAPLALERFLTAAERAEEWRLLFEVGRRFLDRASDLSVLVGPVARAAFALERYADCAALFDRHRSFFTDPVLLQKAALALLFLGRNREAEQILLALYRKMTGRAYTLNYEEAARQYAPALATLEKRKKRDAREDWELGMAYLFNQRYDDAMRIFAGLQKSAA